MFTTYLVITDSHSDTGLRNGSHARQVQPLGRSVSAMTCWHSTDDDSRNSWRAGRVERVMVRSLILLIVGVVFLTPSSASAAYLHVERLGTGLSPIVASPEHLTTAYLRAPDALVVGSAGRRGQAVMTVPGCVPVAAAARAIAMTCDLPNRAPVATVLDRRTGALAMLRLPARLSGGVSAIGSDWALLSGTSSPDEVHSVRTRRLINWRTQRIISLGRKDDPYGSRRYVDLDAKAPGRRLCSPVRRLLDNDIGDLRYLQLAKVGRWTLHHDVLQTPSVQKCGSRARRRLKGAFSAVLGNDFVGYLKGRRIVYFDLRTGKRQTRPWPTSEQPRLAAAGRRLIMSARAADGTYRLYRSRAR